MSTLGYEIHRVAGDLFAFVHDVAGHQLAYNEGHHVAGDLYAYEVHHAAGHQLAYEVHHHLTGGDLFPYGHQLADEVQHVAGNPLARKALVHNVHHVNGHLLVHEVHHIAGDLLAHKALRHPCYRPFHVIFSTRTCSELRWLCGSKMDQFHVIFPQQLTQKFVGYLVL